MKDRAVRLREQGWTYKDIARETGFSLDWCKRNLKDVEKGVNDPVVYALVQAATRPEGCTHYEASAIVYKEYGDEQVTYEKIRQYKRSAVAANSECLFRPNWMSPSEPKECTRDLMMAVSNLWDRVTEETLALAQKYPDASFTALQRELLHLLSGNAVEGVETRCSRHQHVATALYYRTSCECT